MYMNMQALTAAGVSGALGLATHHSNRSNIMRIRNITPLAPNVDAAIQRYVALRIRRCGLCDLEACFQCTSPVSAVRNEFTHACHFIGEEDWTVGRNSAHVCPSISAYISKTQHVLRYHERP